MKTKASILVLVMTGCAGSQPPIQGNAALGIAEFRVTQSATELRVVGLDVNKAQVAAAVLTVGPVVLPDDGRQGNGRTLSLDVKGHKAQHMSIGMDPLTLPLWDPAQGADTNAFLTDPYVASALKSQGISFQPHDARSPTSLAGGERAYNTCTHSTTAACGASDCCEYTQSGTVYEAVCCAGIMQGNVRACNSCTSGCGGTSTVCGGAGPSGCAPCWTSGYNYTCGAWAPDGSCSLDTDCLGAGSYCGEGSCGEGCALPCCSDSHSVCDGTVCQGP